MVLLLSSTLPGFQSPPNTGQIILPAQVSSPSIEQSLVTKETMFVEQAMMKLPFLQQTFPCKFEVITTSIATTD